jgi:hypothetical protein
MSDTTIEVLIPTPVPIPVPVLNDELIVEVERLRADLAQRTADVAKAKAERDEARRSACMVKARYLGSIDGFPRPTDDEIGIKARAIARGIGWDCFKEEVRP